MKATLAGSSSNFYKPIKRQKTRDPFPMINRKDMLLTTPRNRAGRHIQANISNSL